MNRPPGEILMACEPWAEALAIQQQTVKQFHRCCAAILEGQVDLRPLSEKDLSLQRNLFSTLFIMATGAAGVPVADLPFYAMVFQCLRAQVTGCDNILDDEYKSVIPFALPGEGTKFRSVLTIMTSDMILAKLAIDGLAEGRIDRVQAGNLPDSVLQVLIPSGIEEHEEESLPEQNIPPVAEILQSTHPRKTGSLFAAPILLADRLRATDPQHAAEIAKALSDFGVGCQILDDLKDIADDLSRQRHNLILSHAAHDPSVQEKQLIDDFFRGSRSYREAELVAEQLIAAKAAGLEDAAACFRRSQEAFCRCFPSFSTQAAKALGSLIEQSIMSQRNDASSLRSL